MDRFVQTKCRKRVLFLLTSFMVLTFCGIARADVALLIEEPYGEFGSYNPTGHAAVFLSNVCAETLTQLRRCHAGEYGAVISRYHKIHSEDWMAVPLIPYLYAVETADDIPATATGQQVKALREAYWHAHLTEIAPPDKSGNVPEGEWPQLAGSIFDRTIFAFSLRSTAEQDDRFIAIFNDRPNVAHFNLFFHNCSNFAQDVLDTYFPGAVHRNILADFGLQTPKAAAKSFAKYGRRHPELFPSTFEIVQVPGDLPRSRRVDGISESLVKSKKYIIPLAILQPEFAGAIVLDYLTQDRRAVAHTGKMFDVKDWEVPPMATDSM